ncbi:MAG TPA: ATP-dependent DNA helicase [Candidatus Eisenbacteria bacterium]|nr:ATP-dependent DNA helicase [Candidatus Eisenbacteria bacterium]
MSLTEDLAAAERPILDRLNDEQRAAVTAGAGPLLVVAGAGTGKTQVLTRRIAWLIATGRARPDEILALTFTEKAANELESRVDVLVPMGMTGAWVSTFHAFADRLVREHAIELGLTSQLRVDSPAEILVFLREHLFELGLERYLPVGRPDQHLRSLVALFDRARDEDVSPEAYLALAERLMREAGDDPERRDRAQAELEKARAYGRYQTLLLENGRVDFGHQIALALRLLRERPWVRRQVRDQFRWVLVDEFQDTNYVQFELIKLLCGPDANLTVVGDDDQSIYRFRGARVENLLAFRDAYPGAREVVLTRNYRSGQRILDVSHRLIQHNNPARLEALHGFDKRLKAARSIPAEVGHAVYATASDEADAVAGDIAGELAAGTRRAGQFAILARTHQNLDPFAAALRARGIKFHRSNTRGLYSRPEVQLCLNVLRALADPDDAAAVHHALADPLFGVDPADLARLNARAARRHRPLLAMLGHAVSDLFEELSEGSRDGIARFLALHRLLAGDAARKPTTEVLYAFVSESGLLTRLTAEDSAENLERLQNLNKLLGITRRVSPLLAHDRAGAFIGHLDLLIEAGDDPAAAEVEIEEDAVQLLTAHNAKGLEFPVVFLVQVVEQRFPQSYRGDQLPLPPELRRGADDDQMEQMREERRLFYVGMTRAQDRLTITSALDYGTRYARKVSRFVVEALGGEAMRRQAVAASPVEALRRHAPPVETPPARPVPLDDDETLTLSHSQISAWLACPLQYKYAHVLHVPLPPQAAFVYGIAVHHALRVYYQHRIQGLPILVDDVIRVFDQAWTDEGFLSREHETLSRERGRDAVRAYVERAEREPMRTVAVEQPFEFRRGPTEILGRFDRLDRSGDDVTLIDYKSTPVPDQAAAGKRAQDEARDGQLGLYALAYRETRHAPLAFAEIHFVGTDLIGRVRVEDEHLIAAADRIDRAAAGIRRQDFTPTPDPRTCAQCDYARYCAFSALRAPA